MPTKQKSLCTHPGCRNIATKGSKCDDHFVPFKRKPEKPRGNSAERGYDETWRRFRRMYLRRYPWCQMCLDEGERTLATLIHHIQPLREGGERLDESNCMPLCNRHHEIIHDRFNKG